MEAKKKVLCDVSAEKEILGAILLDTHFPSALESVRGSLSPEDFYQTEHKVLYAAFLKMVDQGVKIDDSVILPDKLRRMHLLEKVGGASYLAEIVGSVATSGNLKIHADLVLDFSQRRKAIVEAQKLEEAAYDLSSDMGEVLQSSTESLTRVEDLKTPRRIGFKNVIMLGDLKDSQKEAPPPILQREGDNPLLGENQVLTLGGVTGIGKTMMCIQLGISLACGKKLFGIWGPKEPIKVVHVHCEMEHEAYIKQQLNKMFNGLSEWGAINIKLIRENYTFVVGTELSNESQLDLFDSKHQRILVEFMLEQGAKLLILDPLYWMVGTADENLAKEMTQLTKAVKTVTGQANCAIVQTTHYNRAGELPGSYVKSAGVSAVVQLRSLDGYDEKYDMYDIALYLTKARNGMPMDGQTAWYLRFDQDHLWFEADEKIMLPTHEELKHTLRQGKIGAGRYTIYKVGAVKDILKVHGREHYGKLTELVKDDLGCSISTARNLISRALSQGKVSRDGEYYEAELDTAFPYGGC